MVNRTNVVLSVVEMKEGTQLLFLPSRSVQNSKSADESVVGHPSLSIGQNY